MFKIMIECDCHGMDALCEECGGNGKYTVNISEFILIKISRRIER